MAIKKELVSKLTVKCIFYTTTSLAIYFPYMVENDDDAYRLKKNTVKYDHYWAQKKQKNVCKTGIHGVGGVLWNNFCFTGCQKNAKMQRNSLSF